MNFNSASYLFTFKNIIIRNVDVVIVEIFIKNKYYPINIYSFYNNDVTMLSERYTLELKNAKTSEVYKHYFLSYYNLLTWNP